MTTQERTSALQKKGIMNVIESLPESKKYLKFMNYETLENPFPVFTARNYEWKTKEYKAMLLFDCHFGAKSPNKQIAKDQLERFIYVLNQYEA